MRDAVQILDYPVYPRPRWGYGKPQHPLLLKALTSRIDIYHRTLKDFIKFKSLIHSIPQEAPDDDATSPFWRQPWFSCLDATALVCFLGLLRPNRYIEIGSGNSTKFARYTVKSLSLPTSITSIDPHPRAEIDIICDRVIRCGLEDVDLSEFDNLEPGDILFFDGSHRVFTNSDVTVLFFEILPRLQNGVLVHVHDIFLPDDYPSEWNHFFFSEQYLLAALLMNKHPSIEVVLPNCLVTKDVGFVQDLDALFDAANPISKFYMNDGATPGVSFWFKTAFH